MTKQQGSIPMVQDEAMERIRKKPVIERLLAGLPDLEERLKAERVEQFLKLMPEWTREKGSRTISRVREFPDAAAAAKWAAYVQDYAGSHNVVASTLRWDNCVLVTLFGQRRRSSFDFLTPGVLRFALSLG